MFEDWGLFAIIFVAIPLILLFVFALVDLFKRRGMSMGARIIWVIVILFLPIVGPITYYFTRPSSTDITYRDDPPIE